MLELARRKYFDEKLDVVIGIALSHGRQETEKLLLGMEKIPLLQIEYKGAHLEELNVDAILKRDPDLVIVDELAHTNAPGLRHPKRYMDVEELLRAGIDVYTTLNIQHVESYQDTIEKAVGVLVRERIPDRFLDNADEIELIDLPLEELLERLHQGKVYIPEQAKRAAVHFFKTDTLLLLREMALRKAAAIVDIKREQIGSVVPEKFIHESLNSSKVYLKSRLVASIGPSPFSEKIIRVTKRLSDMLRADWYAVSVETPEMAFSERTIDRQQIEKNLRLAEELGATVMKISGNSIAEALLSFSKAHHITQIVIGHSLKPWYMRLFYKSPVDQLVGRDHIVDIYVISSRDVLENTSSPPIQVRSSESSWSFPYVLKNILYPIVGVVLFSLPLRAVSDDLSLPFIAMLYLMSSILAAAVFSTLGFYMYLFWTLWFLDLFYYDDLESFFSKTEGVIGTIAIMIIGLIVNRLSIRRKNLTKVLQDRHDSMRDLFNLSRQLLQITSIDELVTIVDYHLNRLFGVGAVVALKKEVDSIVLFGVAKAKKMDLYEVNETERIAIKWAIDHREPSGCTTNTLPHSKAIWFPLVVSGNVIGAMGLFSLLPEERGLEEIIDEDKDGLEAYVHLMALSLDRL